MKVCFHGKGGEKLLKIKNGTLIKGLEDIEAELASLKNCKSENPYVALLIEDRIDHLENTHETIMSGLYELI